MPLVAEEPLLHRMHLTRADGTPRAWAIALIAWAPLFLGAVARMLVGRPPPPIFYDLSVHGRMLIAIPCLIVGSRLLARRLRDARKQLYDGDFLAHTELDRIFALHDRLRDSRTAFVVLSGLAMFGGIATVTGLVGSTGMFGGIVESGSISFMRVWYGFVALPLVQFWLFRWLWHWALWCSVLLRLARHRDLATLATHPDHAAGLAFLAAPINALGLVVLGFAGFRASVWATQILDGQATLQGCIPGLVLNILAALALGCGPLLAFVPMLYRARHRALREYNLFSLRYVRDFHMRWIERGEESPLGTPDLQSLNDLIGSYEALARVRPVPFGLREVVILVGAPLVVVIPLALTVMPADLFLERLGQLMLGFVG